MGYNYINQKWKAMGAEFSSEGRTNITENSQWVLSEQHWNQEGWTVFWATRTNAQTRTLAKLPTYLVQHKLLDSIGTLFWSCSGFRIMFPRLLLIYVYQAVVRLTVKTRPGIEASMPSCISCVHLPGTQTCSVYIYAVSFRQWGKITAAAIRIALLLCFVALFICRSRPPKTHAGQ